MEREKQQGIDKYSGRRRPAVALAVNPRSRGAL